MAAEKDLKPGSIVVPNVGTNKGKPGVIYAQHEVYDVAFYGQEGTNPYRASSLDIYKPPTPPPTPASRPKRRLGVQSFWNGLGGGSTGNYGMTTRDLDAAKAMGYDGVRVDYGLWNIQSHDPATRGTEPLYDEGPAGSVWGVPWLDNFMDQCKKRGLDVVLTLMHTPRWASSNPNTADDSYRYYAPKDPNVYGKAMGYIAARYKVRCPGTLYALEVWNEPNIDRFWKSSIADYAKLCVATYSKVKASDPNVMVVVASTASADVPWLQKAILAGMAGSCFDATGPHLYCGTHAPDDPRDAGNKYWSMVTGAKLWKAELALQGWGSKKMITTEYGWSTHTGDANTEAQQADYHVRALKVLDAAGIEACAHALRDTGNQENYEAAWGFYTQSGRAKLVVPAIAQALKVV